jgi:hypothetical protein
MCTDDHSLPSSVVGVNITVLQNSKEKPPIRTIYVGVTINLFQKKNSPTPTFIPLPLQTIQYSFFALLLFNISFTKKIQHPKVFRKIYVKFSVSKHFWKNNNQKSYVFQKQQPQTNNE